MSPHGDGPRGLAGGALEELLTGERRRVDDALRSLVPAAVAGSPGPLAEPIAYALATSGKRLRPLLCIAAYRAVRGGTEAPEALYRLSCAPEIVHTYSLVHDDLPSMDDDDLRRGRPTVHRVFGTPRAIMAGAALLSLAVRVLVREGAALGLDEQGRALLVRELCSAAGGAGMVGGQLLDLEGESGSADAAAIEQIHRAKTGALLTASLRIGALAADAGEDQLDALTRYGAAIGLAFQIADDILDVVGDSEALGKTAGRDQALSKSSYPAIHGLAGARAMARQLADEAKEAVAPLGSDELRALADFVVERQH